MSEAEPRSIEQGWNLYAIALEDDPHDHWRRLRESQPVLCAGDGVYFISAWHDVDRVLRDPGHAAGSGVAASFGEAGGLAAEVMRSWLMSLDGEDQKRARGLVRRGFTPRRIEALHPRIEQTTDELVTALEARAGSEPVDLIEGLAFALPSEIIRTLFGIPVPEWKHEVEAIIRDLDDSPGASLAMIEGLAREFEKRLASGAVPDGLLAQLAVPDPELGALTPLEVVANAVLLVTAAIDTTAGLIGNALRCLLDRPELAATLRADPRGVAPAVEETLRFEPPALSCSRRAGRDFELAGVAIPKNAHLLLGLAAANRDPARYPRPDTFELERDFQGLLSFGGGRHHCLGAALARLEAHVAVERVLVRSRFRVEATEPPRWQKKNPTVRALDRFPVRLSPRGD